MLSDFSSLVFNYSPDKNRSEYLAVRQFLIDKKRPELIQDLQRSALRLIKPINPVNNTIEFTTEKGTSDLDDEIKLEKADAFIITSIALGINKVDVTVPTTPLTSQNPILYFPDATAFPGTRTGNQPEATALLAYYMGKIRIESGKYALLQNFYSGELMQVPAAQDEQHRNSNLDESAFSLGVMMPLVGNQNYTITLKTGSGDRTLADGLYNAAGVVQSPVTVKNYATFFLRGFVIKNGAQVLLANNFL